MIGLLSHMISMFHKLPDQILSFGRCWFKLGKFDCLICYMYLKADVAEEWVFLFPQFEFGEINA